MPGLLTRSLALCFLTILPALPAHAEDEIHRFDTVRNWALFNDDGYCWIASIARLPGRQRLVMTVDLEGSAAIFLDMEGGVTFDDSADHVLTLGRREVLFLSQGVWAWTKHESPELFLDAVLDSPRIGYGFRIIDHGETRMLTGAWDTDGGREAFDTLRDRCGS